MEILKYPDPRLCAWNAPLGAWTPEAAAKVEEMWKAMAHVDGVGLAAPQIGWNVRLFIMAIPDRETGETAERVVFDPKVELSGDFTPADEGCLSFPGMAAKIKRWTRAHLQGMTPEGPIDEALDGFPAQAAQHEMDHLDGILFIERMTPADKAANAWVLKDLEKRYKKK
jgi:peptide deformylase